MTEHEEELEERLHAMTDAELDETISSIRGTAKRGRRRKLTATEAVTLAALWGEKNRREHRAARGSVA